MKKFGIFLLCVALLLSLTACTGDGGYVRGMRLLREGDIAAAYEQFLSSTDTRAPRMLAKFAWVPLTVKEDGKNTDYDTEYTYDAAGYPVKAVETVTLRDGTVRTTATAYSYVDGVKRTEKQETNSIYSDNGTKVYDAKGNLTYSNTTDDDGNVVEETFFVYDGKGNLLLSDLKYVSKFEGNEQELFDRSEYTYDDKGRVLTITRNENYFAGTQSVTTYTYAEDGSYEVYEKRTENGAADILGYEKQIHYDAEGRITRQYYKNHSDISDTEMLDEYTYDEKGNKISSVHRVDERTITGSYVYDEKNRLLEMKELDNQGAIKGWEKYTYDEKGSPLTEKTSTDGIAWNEVTYTYDENGLLTAKNTKDAKGRWETITYQYNEDGTVKMEERSSSDGTTVIVYGYDEWGNRMSSLCQSTPAGGSRIETTTTVTRELHYYPGGIPEDIANWLADITWVWE